jgi:hypothetical protein
MVPILFFLVVLAEAPPPPPVDEARFQHFMRVLPDAKEPARDGPDPVEIARLKALNPGHEREVEAVLDADARCTAPVRHIATLRMARAAADRLGPDKLDRMIAFYEGPDFPRFAKLTAPQPDGKPLAPAGQAELNRLIAAYPLEAFAEAMQSGSNAVFLDPEVGAGFAKCADTRLAAFEKAKLKE